MHLPSAIRIRFVLIGIFIFGGCAAPPELIIDLDASSAQSMLARLVLRLPNGKALANLQAPDELWKDLPFPAAEVSIIGFDAEPGPWRVNNEDLIGAARSLHPHRETRERLTRFLKYALQNPEVVQAPDEHRSQVLAAHVTRALATEVVARRHPRAVFVYLNCRPPGLEIFCADTARDLSLLAGEKATVLIWLHDAQNRWLFADGPSVSRLPARPQRADIIRLLSAGIGR